MKTEYEYTLFSRLPQKGVTEVWQYENRRRGIVLGTVKWHGAFRQYAFFPAGGGLVFSTGCLSDVISFINQLASDRRGARKIPT